MVMRRSGAGTGGIAFTYSQTLVSVNLCRLQHIDAVYIQIPSTAYWRSGGTPGGEPAPDAGLAEAGGAADPAGEGQVGGVAVEPAGAHPDDRSGVAGGESAIRAARRIVTPGSGRPRPPGSAQLVHGGARDHSDAILLQT